MLCFVLSAKTTTIRRFLNHYCNIASLLISYVKDARKRLLPLIFSEILSKYAQNRIYNCVLKTWSDFWCVVFISAFKSNTINLGFEIFAIDLRPTEALLLRSVNIGFLVSDRHLNVGFFMPKTQRLCKRVPWNTALNRYAFCNAD